MRFVLSAFGRFRALTLGLAGNWRLGERVGARIAVHAL